MQDYLFINICYSIVIESSKNTFFNEFNESLVKQRKFIDKIISLPKDISEIFFDEEHIINYRMNGLFPGYTINFIEKIEDVKQSPYKFNIVFSSSINSNFFNDNVLLISDSDESERFRNLIKFEELNVTHISEFITNNENQLSDEEKEIILDFKRLTKGHQKRRLRDVNQFLKNIYTYANTKTINSIGIDFEKKSVENGFEYNQIEQEKSINLLNRVRSHIVKEFPKEHPSVRPVNYIFSDMSINLDFLLSKGEYSTPALRNKGFSEAEKLQKAIKLINQNNFKESDRHNNQYINDYIEERYLIENLIALKSASFVTPNIKLPLSNSQVVNKLVKIGECDRGNRKKINQLFNNLLQELNTHALNWCDYLNEDYYSTLKLISNLPLEWISHNDLPLMIRHEVSRISISSGSISTKLITDSKNIILKKEQISKIKIISSFKKDDPIRNDLKHKIEFLKGSTLNLKNQEDINLDISWYEVANKRELVDALNSDVTAITIFDLHGKHESNSLGILALNEENVSIYDIIDEVNISPIIILSACDTNPIDRNHLNTTNALLLAGAKTVLASALPVMSKESSTFIFRLLLRIKKYLPIHLNTSSIKWSTLITGMLRRQYYTELTYLMKKSSFDISEVKFCNLNFQIGTLLDPLHDNWHYKIMNLISENFEIDIQELKNFIAKNFMMPEALKYIQLGNPDLIIIASENHLKLKK